MRFINNTSMCYDNKHDEFVEEVFFFLFVLSIITNLAAADADDDESISFLLIGKKNS